MVRLAAVEAARLRYDDSSAMRYNPPADGCGGVVDGALSEGEMRAELAGGGRVRRCLVVVTATAAGTLYVPYFQLSARAGLLAIARYRNRGLRAWRDLGSFIRVLADPLDAGGFAYTGPVLLVRGDDPRLARLDLAGLRQQPSA